MYYFSDEHFTHIQYSKLYGCFGDTDGGFVQKYYGSVYDAAGQPGRDDGMVWRTEGILGCQKGCMD